jgi:hypothetical protein
MKQYLFYLKDHLKETFEIKSFLGILVLLLCLIGLNYSLDLEDYYIDRLFFKSPIRTVLYFLLQAGSFLAACLIITYKSKSGWNYLKESKFWFYLIITFGIYALDRGFYGHLYLREFFPRKIQIPLLYFVSELRSLLTIFIPFLIFYLLYDRKNINHFYGIKRKGVNWKPYIFMLLIMTPFIGLASTTEAFQSTYPIYGRIKGHLLADYFAISESWVILIYEFFYGLDFLNTELFFRGVLVFVFVRLLGPSAIYPIAVTYCVCHFGKPPLEAVSSFFGGYILGVISLKSENIWGGVFIHAGIAVLMEVFALLV